MEPMVFDAPEGKTFFGHPRGLSTLFFTELWERFSYYGMRALLVLFMTDQLSGGFGMEKKEATAIYGLYTAAVYFLALPGGWMADHLFGQRKAVLIGGMIIAAGHYALAIPAVPTFYLGLCLVSLGTGLLKPNVSAIVADLYPEGGARRDAGFSVFYMGINIGAFAGPLVCGYLGEEYNWHLGFSAAGVGMTFAVIQYVWGWRLLGDAGTLRARDTARSWKKFVYGVGAILALAAVLVAMDATGILPITLLGFAATTGYFIGGLAIFYFLGVSLFAGLNGAERKRVVVIAILFVGSAVFWSGFEQAGSSMNLFARDYADRVILGKERPASWLQAVNPLFIIALAPVLGLLWTRLGDRSPSVGVKFGVALILLSAGFFVMAWGSSFTEAGKVSPMWLVVTYFLHTVGELCLSPVGLSTITKLSPRRLVGQMMGTWFMATALGNLMAGRIAGYIEDLPLDQLFGTVAVIAGGFGLILLALAVPIRKMAGGVK